MNREVWIIPVGRRWQRRVVIFLLMIWLTFNGIVRLYIVVKKESDLITQLYLNIKYMIRVFNGNQRKYNHKRCCGVIIRLNAGIPGQIKNSVRASISNSKNVTSRSSWRKDTYIYIIFNLYIYMSFFPNPNQDRTIGRESLASLLQQPSSNQGLHNSWTVISLALLTIDILRSKFLATKRQFWRCLLKMIWCTPVAQVATALALSREK